MVSSNSDRLMKTLDAVVSSYIRLGIPVGSRYISSNFDIGLRPASIRNLLVKLEQRGLLAKPHVSAGRVPTERAFRSYLDRLAAPPAPGRRESREITEVLDTGLPVEEVLGRVSRLLGKLSERIGVAVAPGPDGGIVSGIETAIWGPGRIGLTVTIEPGMRRTVTLTTGARVAPDNIRSEIDRIGVLVAGKRLDEARDIVSKLRLPKRSSGVMLTGLRATLECLLRDPGCGVYISGTANMVSGVQGRGRLKPFLEALECKETVADLLLGIPGKQTSDVRLGSETPYGSLRGFSIVRSKYRIGTAWGALGIIGPVRMDYTRLLAVLEFASNGLSGLFAGRGGEQTSAAEAKKA